MDPKDHEEHLSGPLSSLIKPLPDLTALKILQVNYLNVEELFDKKIHEIACTYQANIQAIHDKRCAVIKGEFIPTDADLFENDQDLDSATFVPNPLNFLDNGVPDFWLAVLKCGSLTRKMVHPHDEPILKKLINIKVVMLEDEPLGFNLEFVFMPNEYFSNEVLTKTYYLKIKVDKEDPFSYEGPEIYRSEGCTINWSIEKNPTVRTMKKRQKLRNTSMTRIVTKSVKVASFFNFFSPPLQMPTDYGVLNKKQGNAVDYDFEIGEYFKDRLVPRAVLYFTGEIEEESSSDESEEETERR